MASERYGSLPFAEQIAFFRAKLDLPTERWADLWKEAHDSGFMVAGAMKADLLADLRGAVEKAIVQGTTLAEFRQDFDAIVARHGWTGWTGEDTAAGRAWRTRVIYETNLRSSYAAGRWAQIQAVQADRPYLLYRHSDAVTHPRPLHLSWDGLVIPTDDPWWRTHWPPNGWGCKCRAFAVSERDLARMGKTGPDTPPDDGTYEWTDRVTGEVHRIPAGIDPGWDYAPGATRTDLLRQQVERKARQLGPELGPQLLEDVANPPPAPPAPPPHRIIQTDAPDLDEMKRLGAERLAELMDWVLPNDRSSVPYIVMRGQRLGDVVAEHGEALLEDISAVVREEVLRRLRAVRSVGSVSPNVKQKSGVMPGWLRRAAGKFPDSWVRGANVFRISLKRAKRGYLRPGTANFDAELGIREGSTAEHEYTHHLQSTLRGLDKPFQAEHWRRTAGTPQEVLNPKHPLEKGRPDKYVDRYQGREYGGDPGAPLEVMSMAYQALLGEDERANRLFSKTLKNDQEMLKLAMGMLFHWRPL